MYERDPLWKRLGETPARRLRELERCFDLVHVRDNLTVELCALYSQTGLHQQALSLIVSAMMWGMARVRPLPEPKRLPVREAVSLETETGVKVAAALVIVGMVIFFVVFW